jgi:hypothetical protein
MRVLEKHLRGSLTKARAALKEGRVLPVTGASVANLLQHQLFIESFVDENVKEPALRKTFREFFLQKPLPPQNGLNVGDALNEMRRTEDGGGKTLLARLGLDGLSEAEKERVLAEADRIRGEIKDAIDFMVEEKKREQKHSLPPGVELPVIPDLDDLAINKKQPEHLWMHSTAALLAYLNRVSEILKTKPQ